MCTVAACTANAHTRGLCGKYGGKGTCTVEAKRIPNVKTEPDDPSKLLPDPWKAFTQESTNMVYYANPDTRESFWTRREVFEWDKSRLATVNAMNAQLSVDDLDVIFADDVKASAVTDGENGGRCPIH